MDASKRGKSEKEEMTLLLYVLKPLGGRVVRRTIQHKCLVVARNVAVPPKKRVTDNSRQNRRMGSHTYL